MTINIVCECPSDKFSLDFSSRKTCFHNELLLACFMREQEIYFSPLSAAESHLSWWFIVISWSNQYFPGESLTIIKQIKSCFYSLWALWVKQLGYNVVSANQSAALCDFKHVPLYKMINCVLPSSITQFLIVFCFWKNDSHIFEVPPSTLHYAFDTCHMPCFK